MSFVNKSIEIKNRNRYCLATLLKSQHINTAIVNDHAYRVDTVKSIIPAKKLLYAYMYVLQKFPATLVRNRKEAACDKHDPKIHVIIS